VGVGGGWGCFVFFLLFLSFFCCSVLLSDPFFFFGFLVGGVGERIPATSSAGDDVFGRNRGRLERQVHELIAGNWRGRWGSLRSWDGRAMARAQTRAMLWPRLMPRQFRMVGAADRADGVIEAAAGDSIFGFDGPCVDFGELCATCRSRIGEA